MAREAGIKFSPAQFAGVLEAEIDEFSLQAFEALVRADERSIERAKFAAMCNELALESTKAGFPSAVSHTLNIFAGKIRARGETK
jgi:hypothetical protein